MITIVLAIIAVLMYLEGLLFSVVVVGFSHLRARWAKIVSTLIWPVAIPYIVYKIYSSYAPLISQFRDSPLLGALSGGTPIFPTNSPLQDNFLQELLAEDFEPETDKETQGN